MAVARNALERDSSSRGRAAEVARDVREAMATLIDADAASTRDNQWLPRASSLASQTVIVLGAVGAATLVRLALGLITPHIAPFSLYFPAILFAALVGGWRAGAAATVLAVALAELLFAAPGGRLPTNLAALINIAIYSGAASAVVGLGNTVNKLI